MRLQSHRWVHLEDLIQLEDGVTIERAWIEDDPLYLHIVCSHETEVEGVTYYVAKGGYTPITSLLGDNRD